jgi:hypothetical protein
MQMKRNDAFPTRHFTGSDIDEPKTVTIEIVKNETFKNKKGEEETKPCVYFKRERKFLILNRGNWDKICDITHEDDTANWPGHVIELFSRMEDVFGEMKNCVRVRAPAQRALPTKKPSPPPPKPSLVDDLDDAVPF